MGFLGQELLGSIICDECTCSHMPTYNRRRTYLRLHVFVCPPLGTGSPWVNARRSLPPAGCGDAAQKPAAGCRPGRKIPVHATVRCRAESPAHAGWSLALPSPARTGGRTSPRSCWERSRSWPCSPSAGAVPGQGGRLGSWVLSTLPACLKPGPEGALLGPSTGCQPVQHVPMARRELKEELFRLLGAPICLQLWTPGPSFCRVLL